MITREHCPNCSHNGYFTGTRCYNCDYGRTRSGRYPETTPQSNKHPLAEEIEEKIKLLNAHPITKEWISTRIANIAELMVILKLETPDIWLDKGPYLKHLTGYGGPNDKNSNAPSVIE